MKCPHCKTGLEQLLDTSYVPENLWRCPNCPYGKNRFTVDGWCPVGVDLNA